MGFSYLHATLVWVHLLLLALWLGADVGVFLCGQYFRRRDIHTLDQRLVALKLLVAIDMAPRTAFALMLPLGLTLARSGGWEDLPLSVIGLVWIASGIWLWLVWDAHWHDHTARAARDRRVEQGLRWVLGAICLVAGATSIVAGAPIATGWLAWKLLLFGCICVAASLIDICFRPVGPLLRAVLAEGSSDATEIPLRRAMDRTRIWVFAIYGLLLVLSWLGVAKPGG